MCPDETSKNTSQRKQRNNGRQKRIRESSQSKRNSHLGEQGKNSGVQLRSGYRLFTSVANLIPIGSGPVVTDPASSEVSSAQLNNMDIGQPRLGTDFSHFVSIAVGDDEEQT